MQSFRHLAAAAAFACLAIWGAAAEENYASWALLVNPFESTGGGGVMIGEYRPVIVDNRCITNFTATERGRAARSTTTRSSSTRWRYRAAFCAPTTAEGGRAPEWANKIKPGVGTRRFNPRGLVSGLGPPTLV
jgi:hypothetical protein